MNIFPNAEQARSGSRNNVIIHQEIREIEEAILVAIDAGALMVSITTTRMTAVGTGEVYFNVWMETQENRSLLDQMTSILIYFKDLGYSVTRKTNLDAPQRFLWEIMW
jgi:hypothetical protein